MTEQREVAVTKNTSAISIVVHRACRQCGAATNGAPVCIDCGAPTPPPEDLGVVSYYHPRMWRRVWFNVMHALGRRFKWTSTG
jgi:hypothetical protein